MRAPSAGVGTLVAAVALVRGEPAGRGPEVLCARRSAPVGLAGKWELPGGKVEPGERPEDAAHREIGEELGVRIALGDLVAGPGGADWPIARGMTMRVWLGSVVGGEPAPLADHDELRWVPWADLGLLDWLDGDVPVAARLRETLNPRTRA